MNAPVKIDTTLKLPVNRGCYYGGAWHAPKSGREADTINPGTGESLGKVADAGVADVDAAVAAAKSRLQGLAQRAATRARQDAAADSRSPAQARG